MTKPGSTSAAVVAGSTAGTVLALLFWLTEWAYVGRAHYAWALAPGYRAIFWGVTAYGLVLYLLAGTVAGAAVGAVVGSGGRRLPRRLVSFLIVALPALFVFYKLGIFINQNFLPAIRSRESLIGNAVFVVVFLAACFGLWALAHRGLAAAGRRTPALGFLIGVWVLALGFAGGVTAAWNLGKPDLTAAPSGPVRPNVVVFLIETTRADHLGCYGYTRDTTPNIDRLASEGVLYEQYHVNAPFSGPSKASIHTGLYPHHNGVRTMPQRIRDDAPTLAQVFRAHGYQTAGFASGVFMGPEFNYHKGYRTYECLGTPYDRFRFVTVLHGLGLTLNRYTPWYRDDDERARMEDATRGVPRFLSWVDDVHGAPFFCLFELNEPHMLYEPPPPFDTRFGAPDPGYTLMDDLRRGKTNRLDVAYQFEKRGYTARDFERTVALYDGEIAYVDDAIGRACQGLADRGLLDDTIVLITADHGECLGEHGVYFMHAQLYENALHTPMILRYPPKLAPARIPDPVQEVDVFPTLIQLAGLDYEGRTDGVSLLSRIGAVDPPRPIFAAGNIMLDPRMLRYPDYRVYVPGVAGKWRMVRDGPWKLIYIPHPEGVQLELYDLDTDPGEQHNVAADRPEVASRLQGLVEAWIAEDKRGQADVDTGAIDAMKEQLKSLGYVQ